MGWESPLVRQELELLWAHPAQEASSDIVLPYRLVEVEGNMRGCACPSAPPQAEAVPQRRVSGLFLKLSRELDSIPHSDNVCLN